MIALLCWIQYFLFPFITVYLGIRLIRRKFFTETTWQFDIDRGFHRREDHYEGKIAEEIGYISIFSGLSVGVLSLAAFLSGIGLLFFAGILLIIIWFTLVRIAMWHYHRTDNLNP